MNTEINYNPVDFIGDKELGECPRKYARTQFENFSNCTQERISELKKLVEHDLKRKRKVTFHFETGAIPTYELLDFPKKICLDYSINSLVAISDWITLHALEDSKKYDITHFDDLCKVSAKWKSIAYDVSAYYKEVLEHEFKCKLEWKMQTENVMDFQYPGISGWKNNQNHIDGITFYLLRKIYTLLIGDSNEEDFIFRRLNYHISELL